MSIENDVDDDDDDDDDANYSESDDDAPLPPSQRSLVNEARQSCDKGPGVHRQEPIRRAKASRRRQAEEEYTLIKSLTQSMENRHKRKKTEKKTETTFDAFGNYVAKALSELDSQTSHLAQNKINNIIFQAQAGLLSQEIPTQRVQSQPQRHYFQSIMQPAPGMSTSSPQPAIYGQSTASYRDDF